MEFNIKVCINGEEVAMSDLPKYVVTNKVIDRIVNDVKDRGIIKNETSQIVS